MLDFYYIATPQGQQLLSQRPATRRAYGREEMPAVVAGRHGAAAEADISAEVLL